MTSDLRPPTTTQEKQIGAAEASQYSADQVHRNGMDYSVTTTQAAGGSADTSWAKPRAAVPVVAKTETCNVTTLTGTPGIKMSAALNQLTGSAPGKGAAIPVGLRMCGRYESNGGLNIDFKGDLATLEMPAGGCVGGSAISTRSGDRVTTFSGSIASCCLRLGAVTTPYRSSSAGERVSLFREPDGEIFLSGSMSGNRKQDQAKPD